MIIYKVYYARKGRDYWVDVSDNDAARQNLLKHLSQYDYERIINALKEQVYYKK